VPQIAVTGGLAPAIKVPDFIANARKEIRPKSTFSAGHDAYTGRIETIRLGAGHLFPQIS
jgi:hypothetical protein